MDDEARFWIAQEVANTKYTADIRPLFVNGIHATEKKPKVLITDGAPNFHLAFRKEICDMRRFVKPLHIQEVRMDGKVHNNKMERFNGEVRDREKVMRNLKKADTPIPAGYQIFHNYVRPTTWDWVLTIIQNAKKATHGIWLRLECRKCPHQFC